MASIEQLVGDLGDEETEAQVSPPIVQLDTSTWQVQGSASLEDLSEALGIPLAYEDHDTFNGLVFGTLGTVPQDGSQFDLEIGCMVVKVISIREHQVENAIIHLKSTAPVACDDASGQTA